MIPLLFDAINAAAPVLASAVGFVLHMSDNDSNSGGELAFLLAGPAGGAAFYAYVYRYYRNADKSHQFEKETLIQLKDPVSGQDKKVDEVHGTRDRGIKGDNSQAFRQRVAKLD